MSENVKLSVIILNYNTRDLLEKCLTSIKKYENEVPLEVIVSDNASGDGSSEMVREKFPWVILTEGPNDGFSKGNNRARTLIKGEMVLFLNPDTVVNRGVFKQTTDYLTDHRNVGAITCKLVLPSGEIDKDSKRSFPTPWVAFSHLVLRLDRIFPKSKLFAKYWYGYLPDDKIMEVDVIQGAFILTRKQILDKVGWFDEDYFFNGEDIDLCWKIRRAGWKIIYYPKVFIHHVKGVTTGKSKQWQVKGSLAKRIKIKLITVDSMEKFYRKRLWDKYPIWFNVFVIFGIKIFKIIRITGVVISFLIG